MDNFMGCGWDLKGFGKLSALRFASIFRSPFNIIDFSTFFNWLNYLFISFCNSQVKVLIGPTD